MTFGEVRISKIAYKSVNCKRKKKIDELDFTKIQITSTMQR